MTNKKDDAILQAELGMVQRELEKKTGNYSKKSSKSKFDQQKFLNKMRKNKRQKEKLNYDVTKLNRIYKYPDDIDPEVALKVIKEKLWKESRNVNLINLEMVANMKLENYGAARVNFKKGKFIDEDNSDLCYNIAELEFLDNNIEEAYKIIKNRVDRNQSQENLYLFALVLYVMGKPKESLKELIISLKKEEKSERTYRFYVFFTLLKDGKKADPEMINKFLDKNPHDINIRLVLNEVYLELNKLDKAKGQNKLLKNQNFKEVYNPCILKNKAEYLCKKGDFDKSLKKIDEALKYYSNCICSKVLRSEIYIQQKKYDQLYTIIEKDFKKDPENIFILNEFLRVNFHLEEKDRVNKIVDIILSKKADINLKIFNNEKDILSVKVKDIKDKFYSKLKILLKKHENLNPEFSLEFGNEKKIWKLFRDYRICEKINS